MGFTDRILGPVIERVLAQKAHSGTYPSWLLATAENAKHEVPNLDMPKKQAELYQRLSWVMIAVGRVAEVCANVPLQVLRRVGEETEEIQNHPFELLLQRPNPSVSRFEFLESTFLFRQLTGNAFWWLNKPSEEAPPEEIWNIPSHRLEVVPDGRMYIKGYLYDPGDGRKIPLQPWEIVHFKRFNPFNRFIGMSAIEALAYTASGDLQMQKYNNAFFGENNGRLPGVLKFADPIPDPEWERLKADFAEASKKRNMLLLRNTGPGSIEWEAIAESMKDIEYLNGRRFNQLEIYDALAPGLMQWLSPDTNNANARAGRDAFFELAVHPLLITTGEKISNDVIPLYSEDQLAEFEDVRPKDRELQLREQSAYAQVHTINEIRREWYETDELEDERGLLLPAEIGKIGVADADLPGRDDAVVEPAPPAPPAPDEAAQKSQERDQFRRFAQKRIDEGKPEKVSTFVFEHLEPLEQKALKAEYAPDPMQDLTERLKEAVDTLRSMPYAETVETVE